MIGVKFGTMHSYNDFSLYLTSVELEQPMAKTAYVEVLGSDGLLDLTEYFGDVKFSNRKLICYFETKSRSQAYYDLYERISNEIHGQRLDIILDREKDYYLNGRIHLHPYKSNERTGSIVIEADCEPYKMEVLETNYEFNITKSTEIALVNLKKQVTPKIEVEGTIQIEGNTLTSGTYTIPTIVLKQGTNILNVSGNGTLRISYRRGKL
jgi:hypothetical protein